MRHIGLWTVHNIVGFHLLMRFVDNKHHLQLTYFTIFFLPGFISFLSLCFCWHVFFALTCSRRTNTWGSCCSTSWPGTSAVPCSHPATPDAATCAATTRLRKHWDNGNCPWHHPAIGVLVTAAGVQQHQSVGSQTETSVCVCVCLYLRPSSMLLGMAYLSLSRTSPCWDCGRQLR